MGPTVKITWYSKNGEVASLKCSNSAFMTELFDFCFPINDPYVKIEVEKKGSGDE